MGVKHTIIALADRQYKTIVEVEAVIVGPLALHRPVIKRDKVFGRWVISHIASGGQVWTTNSHALAKKAIKQLAEIDWSMLKTGKEEKVLAAIRPLRAAILAKIQEEPK